MSSDDARVEEVHGFKWLSANAQPLRLPAPDDRFGAALPAWGHLDEHGCRVVHIVGRDESLVFSAVEAAGLEALLSALRRHPLALAPADVAAHVADLLLSQAPGAALSVQACPGRSAAAAAPEIPAQSVPRPEPPPGPADSAQQLSDRQVSWLVQVLRPLWLQDLREAVRQCRR